MGVKTNTVYISAGSIILSLLVIVVNSCLLLRLAFRKYGASMQHYSMLIVKMGFDWFFGIITVVYSGNIIMQIHGIGSTEILFYFGNCIQSMEATLGILNVFIALDRLYAMRKPLHYSRSYSRTIQKTAILSVLLVFGVCFVTYTVTRPPNLDGYTFTRLVNRSVQSIIHLSTVGVLLLSMVVTGVFLQNFHAFLKKQRSNQIQSYAKNVNAANRVVLYLMAAELFCLVVPNFLEVVLRRHVDLGSFGPVIHPLYVLYITISAAMFLISVITKPQSSPPSTVHAVPTSRSVNPESGKPDAWTSGL
uniref:G_PROTEIN_RECEP_F1_2 domain-containing protein n=1 Tax=Steinernema glaseri TaxID=37863 RepID=A0A1I7ZYQ1_9BILA